MLSQPLLFSDDELRGNVVLVRVRVREDVF